MDEKSIGRRIQYFRKKKGLTQQQLAEMIDRSTNHLSAIERGCHSVKLETLIEIINSLDCTADDILADVITSGYQIKSSRLSEELEQLSTEEQSRILDVVETMIKSAKKYQQN